LNRPSPKPGSGLGGGRFLVSRSLLVGFLVPGACWSASWFQEPAGQPGPGVSCSGPGRFQGHGPGRFPGHNQHSLGCDTDAAGSWRPAGTRQPPDQIRSHTGYSGTYWRRVRTRRLRQGSPFRWPWPWLGRHLAGIRRAGPGPRQLTGWARRVRYPEWHRGRDWRSAAAWGAPLSSRRPRTANRPSRRHASLGRPATTSGFRPRR
jgi:hypothetical protein